MPFTPSHMAAALPFLRTPLLPAAVVIGTMAPDVPYYVPIDVPRDLSHSWIGIPTIDLAITMVLFLLWYAALRAPIVDLAPDAIRRRMSVLGPLGWLPRGSGGPGMRWPIAIVLVIASALVGILTHVAWDAFTHDGWLVETLPALASQVGPLPLYKWLQHASTVAGLVILALWARGWVRRTRPIADRPTFASRRARIASWIVVIGVFGGAGLIVWLRGIGRGVGPFDPGLVFLGATVAGAAAGLSALVTCGIWWVVRMRRVD